MVHVQRVKLVVYKLYLDRTVSTEKEKRNRFFKRAVKEFEHTAPV